MSDDARGFLVLLAITAIMLVEGIALSSCGGKKENVVETQPIAPPEPIIKGKCNRVVEQYLPNYYWKGYDECAYQGWMWDCPSNSPEQQECHRRVNGQLPIEKP